MSADPEYVDLLRRYKQLGGVELREQLHDRYLELVRGGTTTNGLPYPDPSDPVAEGADAIRSLAEAIDTRLGASVAWTTMTLASGVSGTVEVCKVNGIVLWRGQVTGTLTAGANVPIIAAGGIPTTVMPPARMDRICATNQTSSVPRGRIEPDASMTVAFPSGTAPSFVDISAFSGYRTS